MVRKSKSASHYKISYRSHEPTRLETFSDAVFAFAVTLIIVSLEVPKSYDELHELMTGFGSFAICFAMLFQIWNIQNIFFRRYGLKDDYTLVLNATLLFVVLFLVYPLKFLFNLVFGIGHTEISRDQVPSLMMIYCTAYTIVFLLFFLMYQNALRQKELVGLTEKEVYLTKTTGYSYLLNAFIGIFAGLVAFLLPAKAAGLSGMSFFLIGPVITLWYSYRTRKVKKLYPSIA
ncbi:MAG: hypothetical protein K0S09_1967 [Sphingobacteriaceae bacterium]|jgi:uncharacterized membrane protein|nr:hypothetical protein [Sphingobacteriaceae bacterium]